MRNKSNCDLMLVILCSCILGLGSFCLAQSSDPESAKLKDSGGKLRKTQVDKTEKDDIIRVETNLIINDVLVFDKKGNTVRDLKISDFVVKEDDKPQEISVFSFGATEAIPRSIVLIIDYSGSQLPYIQTSVEAAKVLVDKLNPQDRMAIVNDNVELVQDFTTDKNLLKEKLEALKTSALSGQMGQSRQYNALMSVLNEMFAETDMRPVIIFQTDGDELIKLKDQRSIELALKDGKTGFSFNDVLTATEKTRATIYSIIPGIRFYGMPEDELLKRSKMETLNNEMAFSGLRKKALKPDEIKLSEHFLRSRASAYSRQQSALNQIAQTTGGLTFYLEKPDQADNVYSQILSEMNVRYLIGYYPTNQERSGRRRKVSIELRTFPEYKVWGRKTYILEEK